MSYPDKATPQELFEADIELRLTDGGLVVEFVDHTHCQVARIPYTRLTKWMFSHCLCIYDYLGRRLRMPRCEMHAAHKAHPPDGVCPCPDGECAGPDAHKAHKDRWAHWARWAIPEAKP